MSNEGLDKIILKMAKSVRKLSGCVLDLCSVLKYEINKLNEIAETFDEAAQLLEELAALTEA